MSKPLAAIIVFALSSFVAYEILPGGDIGLWIACGAVPAAFAAMLYNPKSDKS